MSWASVHLEHGDEIHAVDPIPGYVQLSLGRGIVLMAPVAKAAELYAVLGELLAAAPPEQEEGGTVIGPG